MTTTDSNGIVFLEESDIISPFHTLVNVLQQGTSDAIDDVTTVIDSKITILHRDTIAERDALTASTSTDNPLFVYVKETGLLYVGDDATNWKALPTSDLAANFLFGTTKTTPAPAAGTLPIIEFGRRVYTSVSGGQYTLTYTNAFPNGIGGVIAFVAGGSAASIIGNADNLTTTTAELIIPGQTAGNAMVIYYIAWGW